jgi:membrane protease YdiL (CAAX protease family)
VVLNTASITCVEPRHSGNPKVDLGQNLALGLETSRRRRLILVAWFGTLLMSRLPQIVLQEVFDIEAGWIPVVWIAAGVTLWLLGLRVAVLRPLRAYFLVMTVVAVISAVDPLIRGSAAWRALVPADVHEMTALLTERLLLVLFSIALIAVLIATGTSRREAYLVVGSMSAPSSIHLPGRPNLPWSTVGPIAFVVLGGLTAGLAFSISPPVVPIDAAFSILWVAVIAAALNAFAEEVLYRAAPLSRLVSVIGGGNAVLLLAVWFGLGHFYGGIPSGPAGAVQAGLVALLFGSAMIETRGLAWPWIMHFIIDLVIYFNLALS